MAWRKEYNRRYSETHREYYNKWKRGWRTGKRSLILWLLGNKCFNPYNLYHPDWLNDSNLLQIDHIKGGGCKDYITHHSFIKRVLESIERGEGKYQLLCVSCNWLKRYKNHEVRGSTYFGKQTIQ